MARFGAVVAASAFLVTAAYAGVRLPESPSGDPVVDQPVRCENGELLYMHVYDTNPDTKAAVVVAGPALNGRHEHGEPFVVGVIDDGGAATFFLAGPSGVSVLTAAEWSARFGDTSTGSLCRARVERSA